jgi:hypothetical protein
MLSKNSFAALMHIAKHHIHDILVGEDVWINCEVQLMK